MRLLPLILTAILATAVPHALAQAEHGPVAGVRVASGFVVDVTGAPGDLVPTPLVLVNDGDAPARVRLSVADFVVRGPAGLELREPGDHARSSHAWATDLGEVEVPAGGRLVVPLALVVPAEATPGSYWHVLLVRPLGSERTEEATGTAEGVTATVHIATQFAVAVRIDVGDVPAGPPPGVALEAPALALADGATHLTIGLRHGGAYTHRVRAWVELYDATGATVVAAEPLTVPVYPDARRDVAFDLGVLPPGTYQALVFADPGGDEIVAARFELDTR